MKLEEKTPGRGTRPATRRLSFAIIEEGFALGLRGRQCWFSKRYVTFALIKLTPNCVSSKLLKDNKVLIFDRSAGESSFDPTIPGPQTIPRLLGSILFFSLLSATSTSSSKSHFVRRSSIGVVASAYKFTTRFSSSKIDEL